MLRAVMRNKTRFHHRYLGFREDGERHVCEEDEITSIFFDGLALLTPSDCVLFWHELLGSDFSAAFFPEVPPNDMEWNFWPQRRDSRVIEPDMLIVFRWSDGIVRALLVELKWKSGIGNNQLQLQWSEFLTTGERPDAVHVFIARDVAPALVAKSACDVWGSDRLLLRSWMEVRDSVGRLRRVGGSLGSWATLADRFLEQLQVASFRGFPSVAEFVPPFNDGHPIFWAGASFLSSLRPPPRLLGKIHAMREQPFVSFDHRGQSPCPA